MTFRQRLALSVVATVLAAVFAAALVVSVPAQPTVGLPFGTVATLTASSTQIIGSNPSRRAIQICNGTTAAASVAPAPVTPTVANGVQIPVSTCFTSPPLTASGTSGGAGGAWNGIGNTAVLTILEW
jgi:hypothetical protein